MISCNLCRLVVIIFVYFLQFSSLYLLFFKRDFYIRHRTAIGVLVRVLLIYGCNAYLAFWQDFADQQSFLEWTVVAVVFANSWMSVLFW